MELNITYEDDELLVVNKPNNLLVHHSYYARNIREISLVEQLREYLNTQVYTIHRLDRKTSGLLVFGKQKEVANQLQQQFNKQEVNKNYLALVRGFVEDKGKINSPIKSEDQQNYKDALTLYSPIAKVETDFPVEPYSTARYTLLKLQPKTGRTHQLRKHMNKFAHPIIGDPKYGNRHHNHTFKDKFGHSFLYLHAYALSFKHPTKQEVISFKGKLPEFWFEDLPALGFDIKDLDEN